MNPSPRALRSSPDLDQLKRQAKELHEAFCAGESMAVAEVTLHYHDADTATFALSDAQLALARAHGFASWAKLKEEVTRITVGRLADAVRGGDVPAVRKILRVRPDLVNMEMAANDEQMAIHFAVFANNVEMVRVLMELGANARKGIHPHRDATTALQFARDRGYAEIIAAIEAEERHRREALSCPNVTVSADQDQINQLIRDGDLAGATKLLDANPEIIRMCDRDGRTPLHVAAGAAQPDIVAELITRNANIRKTDAQGQTPLDRAAVDFNWRDITSLERFARVAKLLRDRGAALSVESAVALGLADDVQRFHAENPASFIAANRAYDQGLLRLAVRHHRADTVALLLELGVDANEPQRVPGIEAEHYSRSGPLWIAAGDHQHDVAERLLRAGADANGNVYASGTPMSQAYGARDRQMLQLLEQYGGRADATTVGLFRDVAAARRMIEENNYTPRPDQPAFMGLNLVEQLLWAGACGGSPEIVAMALERINWPRNDPRWFGMLDQPLRIWNHGPGHWVGKGKDAMDRSTYPTCFQMILDRCDPNLRGKFGVCIAHQIVALGTTWNIPVMTEEERCAFMAMALKAGVDISVRDELLRSTPLGWACRWGQTDVVRMLLEHGADVAEPGTDAWARPLAWAKRMGHVEIASRLRTHGAS